MTFKTNNSMSYHFWVQWVKCFNLYSVSCEVEPINASSSFLEQESLPSLLSTGWFKEETQAWFTGAKLLVSQSKLNKLV